MDSVEVVLRIRDVNPHIVCSLCAGYFVDATTIIECLHTFCKSCIVKYLQTSKYCPMCSIQIHETQPLVNLRLDRTMQDIVCKVVPGIQEEEEQRIREFYELRGLAVERPSATENLESGDKALENTPRKDFSEYKNLYRDDELVSLCLERHVLKLKETFFERNPPGAPSEDEHRECSVHILGKKFLRCSVRMMVSHLQKFLRRKLNIPEDREIDILCNGHTIPPSRTMKFIWISEWLKTELPIVLHYRVGTLNCDNQTFEAENPQETTERKVMVKCAES